VTDPSTAGTSAPSRRRGAGRGRQLGAAGAAASGAGAALVATAATACCAGPVLAPLIVGVLGASGAAWAAGLKPYSVWLLGASALLLAYGFWSTRSVPTRCDLETGPQRGWASTAVRAVLWLAAALWLAAVAANVVLGT